jgi:4-alpha-glucanotransferase
MEPVFDWLDQRASGILLHPTSLPSPYGIGSFGPEAYEFAEFLKQSHCRYWQVLPLGPTGYGDSPYQSYSSYALNPLLLDWTDIRARGWIRQEDLSAIEMTADSRVDYEKVRMLRSKLRDQALDHALSRPGGIPGFEAFREFNRKWLPDYSRFMALKKAHSGSYWIEWPLAHRSPQSATDNTLPPGTLAEIRRIELEQFVLFQQWTALKKFCNGIGVELIGDLPIYVSADSADVWANPESFQLKDGKPAAFAGVPPDYFSENGQFWGNPLYDWDQQRRSNYAWWMDRLGFSLRLFNILRFDHFRGLESYWSIPSGAPTAKSGKWIEGPGISFFRALKESHPDAKMILEDLGIITEAVVDLRNATGFPGLAVLQFAFGGGSDNSYLPHNLIANSVLYTGTHDNTTTLDWYLSADDKTKDHVRRYLMVNGQDITWDFIRLAYRSVSRLVVIPAQDLLVLGREGRMNLPGEARGNWNWRLKPDQLRHLKQHCASYLSELAYIYGRQS